VLPAQIVEQLVGCDGEIAYTALEEIAGERGLRRNHELRRLGPASNFAEEPAETAEVLLVCPFVGAYLGYGEAEHILKVRGER
jgi:hypothetical protein